MICNKCGNIVEDNRFCPYCGASLSEDDAQQEQNEQTYEPKDEPKEVKHGKKVDKLAYALFAIFLGWLGIHKFYGGKVFLGVIYIILTLITLGIIPFILGLIEGIMALAADDDGDGNIIISEDKFFL